MNWHLGINRAEVCHAPSTLIVNSLEWGKKRMHMHLPRHVEAPETGRCIGPSVKNQIDVKRIVLAIDRWIAAFRIISSRHFAVLIWINLQRHPMWAWKLPLTENISRWTRRTGRRQIRSLGLRPWHWRRARRAGRWWRGYAHFKRVPSRELWVVLDPHRAKRLFNGEGYGVEQVGLKLVVHQQSAVLPTLFQVEVYQDLGLDIAESVGVSSIRSDEVHFCERYRATPLHHRRQATLPWYAAWRCSSFLGTCAAWSQG